MPSHHRNLEAWKNARETALAIHQYCEHRWSPASATIFDQLRRASLSVPLNIAEGVASGRGARCKYHLRIAFASAVETSEILEFLAQLKDDSSRELMALHHRASKNEAMLYRLWQRTRGR